MTTSVRRGAAAAMFVLFMVAAAHLLMVAVNALDERLAGPAYVAGGVPARFASDLGLGEELRIALRHTTQPDARARLSEALDRFERDGTLTVRTLPVTRFLVGAAALLVLLGGALLLVTRRVRSDAAQSVLGIFAGNLIWTGAVEYGLVFAARSLGVAKTVRVHGGEVVAVYGEYVLLKHTAGLLVLLCSYLAFQESSRCAFFLFFRQRLGLMRGPVATGRIDNYGPRTAFQYASTTWAFYVLLLWAYDGTVFGVHGVFTSLVFFGSIAATVYLFARLVRQPSAGAAVRYAIGTVLVAWNTVEIAGKWGLFQEPWLVLEPLTALVFFGGLALGTWGVVRQFRRLGPVAVAP